MITATDVQAQIRATNAMFSEAIKRGAPEEVASLYAGEAEILPPGSGVVRGQRAIADFWRGALDMGIRYIDLESIELEVLGDTAIERGRYALRDAHENPLDEGKYLVIWKEIHGMWKLHRDIWNSSEKV